MRVPKTGSQSMDLFIRQVLKPKHNFRTVRKAHRVPPVRALANVYDQEMNVLEAVRFPRNSVFLGMHENYINFMLFNRQNPIYISLIRDPVEKVISWFYYIRSDLFELEAGSRYQRKIKRKGMTSWRNQKFEDCVLDGDPECVYIEGSWFAPSDFRKQSLQFCGDHESCMGFGSPIAIQLAKYNVERNFAVVGSWEDTNITLTVLEHYIPKYFRGAKKLFYDNLTTFKNVNRNTVKPIVRPEVKDMILRNFTGELDFYHFCKQRLYMQYLAIRQSVKN